MRVARVLNLAALAGLAGWSVWAYQTLPTTYPIHFDLVGRPDRWAEKGPWLWAGLPLLAVALSAVFSWARPLARRAPGLLNVPRKQLYLELDAAGRERILDRVAGFLDVTGLLTTMLLWGTQATIWHAARSGSLASDVLLVGIAVWTLVVVAWGVGLHRRLGREIEELHRRGTAAGRSRESYGPGSPE